MGRTGDNDGRFNSAPAPSKVKLCKTATNER